QLGDRGLEAPAPRDEPDEPQEHRAVDQIGEQPREHCHLVSGAFVSTCSIMSRILARSPGLTSAPFRRCCTSAVTSPSNSRSVSWWRPGMLGLVVNLQE